MTDSFRAVRRVVSIAGVGCLCLAAGRAPLAQKASRPGGLAAKIDAIVTRPLYRHGAFGIEFLSLDTGQPIYTRNADKLFTPASTTKLLTEGTALHLLGADYRFHTRVYRTGPIAADGTLDGDLVLVASGDPDLSNRIQPDGTLAFENEDHAYDGSPDTKAVPGDPLLVIRELASQIAAHGVKRIDGRVMVDASLFPEGTRELGTGTVLSPVVVNDNVIDVTLTPAATAGQPPAMRVSPETAYVQFSNAVTTGKADSKVDVKFDRDVTHDDGSHSVTVSGSMPAGGPAILFAYRVTAPSRFAAMALAQALQEKGIAAMAAPPDATPDFAALAASYTPDAMVAEHVSPPFSEEVKVTLKVSQNLHASLTPYLLGALVAHAKTKILQAGFDQEHTFLAGAGLDLTGASQGDGAGGALSAFFTPDFMVHYLAFMAKQPDFAVFERALPVLGRDGTLWNIETDSPAAGHVHAKTGTFGAFNNLNRGLMLTAKGLAGYMTTADGRHLAFAIYANRVPLPREDDPLKVEKQIDDVGQALGEIAAAAYTTPR
ncbi:MAG TPA: D-alanyl-D-alanine carboxypeptidase/D-alanyl-D-alanine-endopeptidase [Vicinamibacterales bacterium]|nr:D-alanyl-D-alanine carboxypeptidase/D-alanyl-D-alanine-endopeptidase [Vicinamibacterales bacterium]